MSKKYKVVTKIGNNTDGSAHCVKYNCSDLLSYVRFLNEKFPTWTWTNVYDKETRIQIGNFTKKNLPSSQRPY